MSRTVGPVAMSVLRAKRVAVVPARVAPMQTVHQVRVAVVAPVSMNRPTPTTVARVAMFVLPGKPVRGACVSPLVAPMARPVLRTLIAVRATVAMACAARVASRTVLVCVLIPAVMSTTVGPVAIPAPPPMARPPVAAEPVRLPAMRALATVTTTCLMAVRRT